MVSKVDTMGSISELETLGFKNLADNHDIVCISEIKNSPGVMDICKLMGLQ